MRTLPQTRDLIARMAANFDASPGRSWRPLVDTTNQPTISQRSPVSWVSWQRPEDYYTEGMLIWLDTDTKIREMSGDKKSLDDFARLFFGLDYRSYVTSTYILDALVAALNSVQRYDGATFLHQRVDELAPETPKDGLTRGGYRLSYTETAPEWLKHVEGTLPNQPFNFSTSFGFALAGDGVIASVWWDSPAFKAGITPDTTLVGVNDTVFSVAGLRTAIVVAEKSKAPLKLLLKRGDQLRTVELDYHGGLRYPQLERVEGARDRLDEILAPPVE
jgi:predicted metalloprotease with PDZ domain